MGMLFNFELKLLSGSSVKKSFERSFFPKYIGKGKFDPLYELLGHNTTEGEKGTLFVTSKYAYGDDGSFPLIPPYSAIQLDYHIIMLRYK